MKKLKDKNLVTGPESQLSHLTEQMESLVDGHGYGHLNWVRSTSEKCCEGCGVSRVNKVTHLISHLKWSLGEVEKPVKQGGKGWGKSHANKPTEPPPPPLAVKKPPVLDGDGDWQTCHPLDPKIRAVKEQAKKMVSDGTVLSDYTRLGDVVMPALDVTLVGKDIEYTFLVSFDPKQTRRRKFTYYGTVLSVDVHAKTKGGKDMVSVRVRWHEKGEPIEPVFLNPGMHCELGCEHGWAAVDDGDCSDPREQDDQLHAKAKQRKLDHDCLAFPPPM